MEQLKKREQQILDYMKSEIRKKGYPPTVREICQELNIKSTSTAHKAMSNLEAKGFLRKDPAKPRAYEILGMDDVAVPTPAPAPAPVQETQRIDVVDIPVVGRIAAGTPILAEQNIEETFPIPARYLSRGNNFMLTVRGESMIKVGIYDGDYILVEE
ncbi:MAG: repressor LexA, partial [Firmicutes bacterium]|nr:repressor LexA [Bacillota bacterium]